LANIKSAKKRARQAVKRNQHNTAQRTAMRSSVRKAVKAIEAKDKGADGALKSASAALDSAARKGLIHKNKAARTKSRLTKRLRAGASA
jgi:small subunit ribosomal protein S20